MDNEKVIETAVQDTSVEDSNTVKEESSVQEVETYSKADYEKAIQSASSKAKNEILKSLGINSVKEFQELKNTYQTAINEKTTLEENISNLNKENTKLQEDLLLSKLGVSEEYSNDLLTLAKSKVDENHSLEEVSKELLEKYPQWKISRETIKMGTERSDNRTKEPEIDSALLKKFPWLGN